MDRPLIIPRQALADLLQASGSALTPEAYLESLQASNLFKRYPSRAVVSTWSKGFILAAAVLSVLWLGADHGFESILIAGILVVITFFEYRVNTYFKTQNPKAPELGFINQSSLAAIILLYGLFHAIFPAQIQGMVETDNVIDPATIKNIVRTCYLVVGIVGGLSQFALALYYRSARIAGK